MFKLAVKGIRSACIFLAPRPNGLFSAQAQWAFTPGDSFGPDARLLHKSTQNSMWWELQSVLWREVEGASFTIDSLGDLPLEWRWGGDEPLSVISCQVLIWGSRVMGGGSHGTCYLCFQHKSLGPMASPHLPSSW